MFCCWFVLPKREPPVPNPVPVPLVLPKPPPVVEVVPPNKLGCEVPDVPPNREVAGFCAPNRGFEEVVPKPPVVWVWPNADGALVPLPNAEPKPEVVFCCPKPVPPNAEVPNAPA